MKRGNRERVMKFRSKPSLTPTDDELENASAYCFKLDNSADYPGSIFAESGRLCWRFETLPRRSAYSPLNLFRKPVFVALDVESHEVLRIRVQPGATRRFDLIQDGLVVGTIQRRGFLRSTYTCSFSGGPVWTVKMPLFTLLFQGKSTNGLTVWIRVGPSKKQWNVLTCLNGDDVRLIAALAFIHREWWCYS